MQPRTAVLVVALVALVVLGGCGSGKHAATPATTTTTAAPAVTSSTAAVASTTTSSTAAPTSTSGAGTTATTAPPCPAVSGPHPPVTVPVGSTAMQLTAVGVKSDACVDRVGFTFSAHAVAAPSYTVTFGTPPFVQDASGAPVAVAGNAFVVVKVHPGYGYDFETGAFTYTGSKRATTKVC